MSGLDFAGMAAPLTVRYRSLRAVIEYIAGRIDLARYSAAPIEDATITMKKRDGSFRTEKVLCNFASARNMSTLPRDKDILAVGVFF